MARILPALLLAQYGVTISTFDSHASILQSSSCIIARHPSLMFYHYKMRLLINLSRISLSTIRDAHLPLSELRFFPNDCLVFLFLPKYSSPTSPSACNSSASRSLDPPSGKSCLRVSLLFLRVLVRCPGSLES